MGGAVNDAERVMEVTLYPIRITKRETIRFVAPHYLRIDSAFVNRTISTYTDGTTGWQSSPAGAVTLSRSDARQNLLFADLIKCRQE